MITDDVPPMTTTDGRDVPATTAMDERVPLITTMMATTMEGCSPMT